LPGIGAGGSFGDLFWCVKLFAKRLRMPMINRRARKCRNDLQGAWRLARRNVKFGVLHEDAIPLCFADSIQ